LDLHIHSGTHHAFCRHVCMVVDLQDLAAIELSPSFKD
jgi:hypothetical protein